MTSAPGSLSVVTRHAPNNLKRAALFAALFVCVGLGITLFLAATQWFSEWTPLYIMAAASLPITFITTVISTSQEDESSLKRMAWVVHPMKLRLDAIEAGTLQVESPHRMTRTATNL